MISSGSVSSPSRPIVVRQDSLPPRPGVPFGDTSRAGSLTAPMRGGSFSAPVRGGSFSAPMRLTSPVPGCAPGRSVQLSPAVRQQDRCSPVHLQRQVMTATASFATSPAVFEKVPTSKDDLSASLKKQTVPYTPVLSAAASPQHPPPTAVLQTELKDVHTDSEMQPTQHQQFDVIRQRSAGSGREQPIMQQVEKVQQEVSSALETEVKQLCMRVATQQMEQAAFLQTLREEMSSLRQQLPSTAEPNNADTHLEKIDELCDVVTSQEEWKVLQEKKIERVHTELDTLTIGIGALREELQAAQDLFCSGTYADLKQLRLEVDGKLSHQGAKLESCQASSSRIEELHAHHSALSEKVESELQSLRQMLGEEAQATSTLKDQLAQFQRYFDENRKEANISSSLMVQTQADVSALRDLLSRDSAQQDQRFREESLEMIRNIKAEVDQLQIKTAHIATDLASKESSDAVEAMRRQLEDQRVQLEALGSTSKAVAEAREAEAQSMQRNLEEQLRQHADLVLSLNEQVADLSDFAKRSLPVVQQSLTQPELDKSPKSAGQNAEVALLKDELAGLKLQLAMQRTLRTAEVVKEADALQGSLQTVIGSEREARIQDTAEMRTLIKNMYDKMTEHFNIEAVPAKANPVNAVSSKHRVSTDIPVAVPIQSGDPAASSIEHLEAVMVESAAIQKPSSDGNHVEVSI